MNFVMRKTIVAMLIVTLAASCLMLILPVRATQTPSVPEFTVKYVDLSYDVPPTYGTDQYTGKTVMTQEGEHIDNRTVEFTIKNQPFTPYTDSSGNNIKLYYNFRFKGNYGDSWIYYPEDSNGQSTIHYGGGIQVDDTQIYPPMYTASNSDYTVVSLRLSLLGPPVGSQAVPDGVAIDFQAQALIGYFNRNDFGYYILTGQSSGWSNTQTISIGETAPTSTPSAFPPLATPNPTSAPTAAPQQPSNPTGTAFRLSWEQTAIIVLIVLVAVLLVVVGLLWRKISTKYSSQRISLAKNAS